MEGSDNKNCWLVQNLGYRPSKRCEQCDLHFRNCPIVRYFFITTGLIAVGFAITLVMGEEITKSFVVSIMVITFGFGYFSNNFTNQLIEINHREKRLRGDLSRANKELKKKRDELEEKVRELDKFRRFVVDREMKMVELKKRAKELSKKLEGSE